MNLELEKEHIQLKSKTLELTLIDNAVRQRHGTIIGPGSRSIDKVFQLISQHIRRVCFKPNNFF